MDYGYLLYLLPVIFGIIIYFDNRGEGKNRDMEVDHGTDFLRQETNHASGLPMENDCFDVAGNPYGAAYSLDKDISKEDDRPPFSSIGQSDDD